MHVSTRLAVNSDVIRLVSLYREMEEGISGLAVPVHAANGRVIAAANISVAPARIQEAGMRDYLLERLRSTVHAIEERLRTA